MAARSGDKRGLEHLDEYEPKPAKHMRSLHDRMAERRLVVILEGATLETVKVKTLPRWWVCNTSNYNVCAVTNCSLNTGSGSEPQ